MFTSIGEVTCIICGSKTSLLTVSSNPRLFRRSKSTVKMKKNLNVYIYYNLDWLARFEKEIYIIGREYREKY